MYRNLKDIYNKTLQIHIQNVIKYQLRLTIYNSEQFMLMAIFTK